MYSQIKIEHLGRLTFLIFLIDLPCIDGKYIKNNL